MDAVNSPLSLWTRERLLTAIIADAVAEAENIHQDGEAVAAAMRDIFNNATHTELVELAVAAIEHHELSQEDGAHNPRSKDCPACPFDWLADGDPRW